MIKCAILSIEAAMAAPLHWILHTLPHLITEGPGGAIERSRLPA